MGEGNHRTGAEGARFKRTRGAHGEDLAAAFLQNKGYWIVARNWRNPSDEREEIDLICLDGEALVFVEVKTRQRGSLTRGFNAVDIRKKRALRRAIQAFLWRLPQERAPATTRFDIVEVELANHSDPEIYHYDTVSLRTPRPWR